MVFSVCLCVKGREAEGGSQSQRPVDNNNVTGGGLWSAFWNSLLGGSLQLHIFWVNINFSVLQGFTITSAWTVNMLKPTVYICMIHFYNSCLNRGRTQQSALF